MKLIAQLKLQPTPEQAAALRRTLETANAACNSMSETAWHRQTFRAFDLHKLCYASTRESFGLSAQVTVRCLSKVADAYQLDRQIKRTFRPHGSIAYDDRILSWNLHELSVSIWTIAGRQSIRFVAGMRQLQLLHTRNGETDLAYVKGVFYLLAACDVEEPAPLDSEGVLGVDLGVVNLATDSDGEMYSGAAVEQVRQRYQRRRDRLQAVGTKNAKRRLKQISGRQRRFQQNTNHRIAKQLVAKAERTKRRIAVEDLTGIRARARVRGPQQRAKHSNWSFHHLRSVVHYKAALAGVRVLAVDPAYTSQTCNVCGCVDKRNRPDQAAFRCRGCGHTDVADKNAACNIRDRAVVNLPMASALRG